MSIIIFRPSFSLSLSLFHPLCLSPEFSVFHCHFILFIIIIIFNVIWFSKKKLDDMLAHAFWTILLAWLIIWYTVVSHTRPFDSYINRIETHTSTTHFLLRDTRYSDYALTVAENEIFRERSRSLFVNDVRKIFRFYLRSSQIVYRINIFKIN